MREALNRQTVNEGNQMQGPSAVPSWNLWLGAKACRRGATRQDAILLSSPFLANRRRSRQLDGCRTTKRMQRDATAVSIVSDVRRFGSFAERQQLVEGAPLMRMPFGESWVQLIFHHQ